MSTKESTSTKTTRTHVISRSGSWAVKKEGASRATSIYKCQKTAVRVACKSAAKGSDIIVHKKDGSIKKWTTK